MERLPPKRPSYEMAEPVLEQHRKVLLGCQTYYRAFSLVNGGRRRETDLLEGLR